MILLVLHLIRKKNDARYGIEKSSKSYSNQVRRPISLTKGGQIIIPSQFLYTEKILLEQQKPIDDHRKLVVGLILSRYLINIRGLDYEQAHKIIWDWLNKCAQLRRLQPSTSHFDRYVVEHQINEAQDSGRLPMTLQTMQAKYSELYETLGLGGSS
jgi:Primase X